MKLNKRLIIFILAIASMISLIGCAYVTSNEQAAATRYLKGACQEAFLSSRTSVSSDGFGYQYHRYKPRAFAVANYGDTQVCNWYYAAWNTPQSQVNQSALNLCNGRMPPGMTCQIFAEDDRIINAPPNYTPVVAQESTQLKEGADSSSGDIKGAKQKCLELGLKAGTEEMGKCVLQLSK